MKMMYVYRMYNAMGDLLYIGCTGNPKNRMNAHKSQTPWFHEVADITYEEVHGFHRGWQRETVAIYEEQPVYNVVRSKPLGGMIKPLEDMAVSVLTPAPKLRRLIYRGKLQAIRRNGRWYVHLDDEQEYVANRGGWWNNSLYMRKEWSTTSDAAWHNDMYESTLIRGIQEGKVPCRRLGGTRYVVRDAAVKQYAERIAREQREAWEAKEHARWANIPQERPSHIPERDWNIVIKRMQGSSLTQIGSELGITRERVRQIEMRTRERLRAA